MASVDYGVQRGIVSPATVASVMHRAGCNAMICGLNHAILALVLRGVEPHPTIVIDPGHPSEVSSGTATQHGTSEVHIAWLVAQRLAAQLRDEGYTVLLTKPAERTMVTN